MKEHLILVTALLMLVGGIAASSLIFEYVNDDDFRTINSTACKTLGFICDGCESSYFCTPSPSGGFELNLVENCSATEKTCLSSTGQCTSQTNLECNFEPETSDFKCHRVGMFPDPFDCTIYHMCIEENHKIDPVPRSYVCNEGYAYNPLTTLCSRKMNTSECTPLIEPCGSLGQFGAIPTHPNMYYICMQGSNNSLYPNMYMCPNGFEFFNGNCSDPPSGVDIDGKCITIGLFYDRNSCNKYFQCVTVGAVPVAHPCAVGTVFDHKQAKCVDFKC